ncbi:MAG: hypothetical protein AAFR16_12180, partial [Pseudomonadota bacterium]
MRHRGGATGGRARALWRAAARGHFGELLQGRLGPEGPVALVTLPCQAMTAQAWLAPAAHGPLTLSGAGGGAIARRAARAAAPGLAGRLRIETAAPIQAGAGSSTLSALLAARLARAAAGGAPLDPRAAARICLAAEGAVDPLMWPEPERLLWASRRARALRRLPPGLPALAVGGFAGDGARTDPADADYADISDLIAPLAAARRAGDAAAAGRIASASAGRLAARRGGAAIAA